ncbi:MAG: methyltransferase domain-containing protein [Eubacterium sp.]|nr:methyltransferase domain-containing protein [Eubacterium sp.]
MSSQDIKEKAGCFNRMKKIMAHLYIRMHAPMIRLMNQNSDLIRKEIEHLDTKIKDIQKQLDSYEVLCENVRNIKIQLEGYESLIENVRNTNRRLEGYESLNENVRNTNRQLEGYESLLENVRNINRQLEGYESLADLAGNMAATRQDLDSIAVNIRNNNAKLETIDSTLDMYGIKIAALQKAENQNAGHVAITEDNNAKQTAILPDGGSQDKHNPQTPYGGIDYFDFENHFRGSRAQIKKNQEIYLEYFQGRRHVLDLGCGRGEFMELLKEHGIQGYGVDLYGEFVELCQQKQLCAEQGDAVAFLEQTEETDGIFAGQLIEHLPLEQLIRLTELAYEKLKTGAFLILETPNPTSLAIYTNSFYMDPSHNKPVHPLTMKYLLEKAGFQEITVIFTESSRLPVQIPELDIAQAKGIAEFNDAMKKVERSLYGSQDYAIVARK